MRNAMLVMCLGLGLGCASEPTEDVGRSSYASGEECKSNDHCVAGEYCDGGKVGFCPGDEDFLGVCAPRPEFCILQWDPVCGCDGVTYSNACYAAGAGQNVAYEGECIKS